MKAEQIEELNEIKQLKCLFWASLISADVLIDADTCKNAISIAKNVLENIDDAKISEDDKNQWKKYMNDAIEIATR